MRILAIGDPHFMVSNIEQCNEMIEKTVRLAGHAELDCIVILGDILHTHEKVHVGPYNLAVEFIKTLSNFAPTFLLIGNHDYINNQQFLTSNHAFNSLKGIENIFICDRVFPFYIENELLLFVPYVPNGRFIEALETLKTTYGQDWRTARCIFAHQEFYGCQLNPLVKSVQGDKWKTSYPMVVSGHIHNRHYLQENIYYVGSAMQHAFNETSKKSHAILEIKKGGLSITTIDLELKQKKVYYETIQTILSMDTTTLLNKYKYGRHYIKFVLKGDSDEIKLFKKSGVYKTLKLKNIKLSFMPNNRNSNVVVDGQTGKTTMEQHYKFSYILEKLIHDDTSEKKKYIQDAYVKIFKE